MSALPQYNDDLDRALSALDHIEPPLEREPWVKLLMAAHDAGVPEDEARAWSERGENFDASDFRATWRSIKPGPVTRRTLFKSALDAGWNAPAEAKKLTQAERAQRDAERAQRREHEAAKRAEREAAAAIRATKMWVEAEPANDEHPYLMRKRVPAYGLKIGRWERTDRDTGEVHTIEDALLVQMRDMGKKTHSVQFIFPDGDNVLGKDRVYLAGGTTKGHFFPIGQPKTIDGKKTIVIAEGYATGASIHKCTGSAVVIAFAAGNLEPVARAIREGVPEADIVVFSDRDAEALAESVGTKMALKAALAIGARIVVPEWCGLDGRDANDIDRLGLTWRGENFPGADILRNCVKFATPFRSPAFMELLRECGLDTEDLALQAALPAVGDAGVPVPSKPAAASKKDATPFGPPVDPFGVHKPPQVPMDVLPAAIAAYAHDQAGLLGCDPSFISMSALVAAASAIHDGIKLQVKSKDPLWLESPRLWVALVGDPSTGKSPAVSKATRHMRRLDAALREQNDTAYAQYREQHDEWKDTKKKDRDAREPKEPPRKRMVVEDITVEALSEVLRDNDRGVLCLRDELAGWIGSMDSYKAAGKGGSDRASWLETYNGGPRSIDRVVRGAVHVPNWSVCIIGGIQPDTMRRIASTLGGDGLLQRFMPIVATPRYEIGEDRAPDHEAMTRFSDLFDQLARIMPGNKAVIMTEAAYEIRERVELHAKQMMMAFDNDHMKAWLGKWAGLFARLVLTYHVIECAVASVHPCARQVTAETAEKVERLLCGVLLHHAIHFYTNVIDAHDRQEHMRQLARLILARGWTRVTSRDIAQHWKAARKLQPWEVRNAVEGLATMAWLEPDVEDLGADGKPRAWDVNPAVHKAFTQHADEERERRRIAAEKLRELQAAYGMAEQAS
ncbi:DUF3987 domain-containing protein [Bradyrhizobium sp. USDA 3364]